MMLGLFFRFEVGEVHGMWIYLVFNLKDMF